MATATLKLYTSAPLEKDYLEQRLERKLKDLNCFNNHISNIKEMTAYFKEKNHKSKKYIKILKLNTKL